MAKSVAYGWDIVGCELVKVEADIPDECTPKQALILFDAALEELGEGMGTYKRTFRQVGDVHAMDGMFGRDQECHLYWCPDKPAGAKQLALKELSSRMEED